MSHLLALYNFIFSYNYTVSATSHEEKFAFLSSGVIMEVSFQNGPLCIVVILEHLATVLAFWKDMILLYSSCFLSKYNLLYHANNQ